VELVKQFLGQLPDFIVQIIVDSLITQIVKNGQIFHIVWFEVLSTARPLTPSQKSHIKTIMDEFPTSSVGESGTFLDLLFPILYIFDALTYDSSQLQNVLQDPSLCA
jgi:hypothetical protein